MSLLWCVRGRLGALVSDMSRARTFYESLFGFEVMTSDERFCAFRVGHDVLVLFKEGESKKPVQLEGGIIPPHETQGAGHFASAHFSKCAEGAAETPWWAWSHN